LLRAGKAEILWVRSLSTDAPYAGFSSREKAGTHSDALPGRTVKWYLGQVRGGRFGASMIRERALTVVLVVVGVLFVATAYPAVIFVRQEPALSMMFSLYVTLGVFLLLAARNPAGHRSLILFTAWSSLVHAAVMGYQGMRGMVARGELIGVGVLVVIGVVLIALVPAKQAPMDQVAP